MIEEQMEYIEKLVKENELIFGSIQDCCMLYERFCRCESYKKGNTDTKSEKQNPS